MQSYVIIVAGGQGLRMGSSIPKQFLLLKDRPIIFRTIDRFLEAIPDIKVIVVLHPDYVQEWEKLVAKYSLDCDYQVCAGGKERFFSVKNGLDVINEDNPDIIVGIHDAVRPFVSKEVIKNLYSEASKYEAVIPTLSSTETVRFIDSEGKSHTIDRDKVQLVQTPQVFNISLLRKAYRQPYSIGFTDDASVVEAYGHDVKLTIGNKENIKITSPVDMKFATIMLEEH